MQQCQMAVSGQYGENERCNRNNLFRVYVAIVQWFFVNGEISFVN
jgi:hypothetical protein